MNITTCWCATTSTFLCMLVVMCFYLMHIFGKQDVFLDIFGKQNVFLASIVMQLMSFFMFITSYNDITITCLRVDYSHRTMLTTGEVFTISEKQMSINIWYAWLDQAKWIYIFLWEFDELFLLFVFKCVTCCNNYNNLNGTSVIQFLPAGTMYHILCLPAFEKSRIQ